MFRRRRPNTATVRTVGEADDMFFNHGGSVVNLLARPLKKTENANRNLKFNFVKTCQDLPCEAQEGSPPSGHKVTVFQGPRSPGHFFHEKIKTTQVTGRFFKLSRSRGRPQNGPRSQVAKNPSWASHVGLDLAVCRPLGVWLLLGSDDGRSHSAGSHCHSQVPK